MKDLASLHVFNSALELMCSLRLRRHIRAPLQEREMKVPWAALQFHRQNRYTKMDKMPLKLNAVHILENISLSSFY